MKGISLATHGLIPGFLTPVIPVEQININISDINPEINIEITDVIINVEVE